MKKQNVIILLVSTIITIAGVLLGLEMLDGKYETKKVRLQDDFYTYINYEEFQKRKIPSDIGGWDRFSEIQTDVNSKVYLIVKEMLSDNENKKLNDYYETLTNIKQRNELNIKPIEKYVNQINNVKSIEELFDLSLNLYKKGVMDFLIDFNVTTDFRDSDKMILITDYVPCFLYTDKSYSQMLELSENTISKYLELYGYEKSIIKEMMKEMDSYDRTTCENTMTLIELQDTKKINIISTKEDLKKIYSNIDIEYYFNELGYKDIEELIIVDETYHKNVNKSLTKDNLQVLKDEMITNLISQNALFLSEDFYNEYQNMENLLNGTDGFKDIDEYAIEQIKDIFSSDIAQKFIDEYFDKNTKEYIEEMIEDIKKQYIINLNNNTWLSEETKEMAIKKLENLTVRVGYPEILKDNSNLYDIRSYEEGGNALENEFSIRIVEEKKELELLYGLDKLGGWEKIPLLEVNAYYNPHDNSINFPVAISYIVDNEDSYYTNLGKIGMIISHEISHAFDSNGSLYDEKGNMTNWWKEEDREKYEEMTKNVVEYYSNFKNPYGTKINGELTLGENIADLGAVECITSIAQNKNANKKELKELYESFAKMWANEYNEAISKKQILTDNHSPNNVRVNATLSSNDLFYKTYNIKENDKMFISKEKRVKIW